MVNIIDFRTIKPNFQSGLIFSLFEGLINGESIRVLVREDPDELKQKFEAAIGDCFEFKFRKATDDTWVVEILKRDC